MDRDAMYEEINSLEMRINFIMRLAGYFDIVYGIAMALISVVVWGAMSLGFLQGVSSLILGILIIFRNSRLEENAWIHQDTILFLTILNLGLGFVISSLLILYVYLTRRKIEQMTLELEQEVLR
ncbi:hypothetical protein [Lactobacillus crispatus]|uniref:Uncharacterized protein n=1 Tax=Lactobacillus crispatus TaxID=47770 RepID=A0AAN5W7F2_9LACO|nr:hypothetical protein [Lactobacillus crispatus]KAA8780370.1 hypothetical protein F1C01_10945 [Lactobacillus crispatus]KAA8794378.1 hypothetical protein F1C00_05485 [Lactobacillus crispatus]KAA8797930.1 hypothetical protein F1C02_05525 [Lactobacillus crispatus]KAA8801032.1 hypothetical protein F1C03_05600 [Lactobacillus crispatus]KAA8801193.1 hypothetical protein F1C04_09930 [Lactobacillus crispatus]